MTTPLFNFRRQKLKGETSEDAKVYGVSVFTYSQ